MGKHVISLISGHLGGANDFSIKIAESYWCRTNYNHFNRY